MPLLDLETHKSCFSVQSSETENSPRLQKRKQTQTGSVSLTITREQVAGSGMTRNSVF